jgi:hypothetical protein
MHGKFLGKSKTLTAPRRLSAARAHVPYCGLAVTRQQAKNHRCLPVASQTASTSRMGASGIRPALTRAVTGADSPRSASRLRRLLHPTPRPTAEHFEHSQDTARGCPYGACVPAQSLSAVTRTCTVTGRWSLKSLRNSSGGLAVRSSSWTSAVVAVISSPTRPLRKVVFRVAMM